MSERPSYEELRRDTIRKGASGSSVAELQSLLNAWNEDFVLKLDGKFGSATEAAVKQFQASSGLDVDGVAGPETWSMLLQSVAAGADPIDELVPEDQSPDVAVLMMAVDQAMDELKTAVAALVGGVGRG